MIPNAAARDRLSRLAEGWLAPVPGLRLARLRLLVCGYATVFVAGRGLYLLRASHLADRNWQPLGPLWWLGAPPPRPVVLAVWLVALGGGGLAAVGYRPRVTVGVLASCFLLLGSYGNSWGQLFHTEHLVSLHLVILAVAYATAVAPTTGATTTGGWPLRPMTATTALTYLLAGVAKVRLGGWDWVRGDALLYQVAYDNIRKELVGSVSSPVAGVALSQAW